MVDSGVLARELIAPEAGALASAKDVADRASRAANQLSQHLSRLIGDTGIKSLAHRSIMEAGQTFPWLAKIGHEGEADPCSAMRATMEEQDAEAATDAFILVWTTFVALLGEMIGRRLVEGLLHEIWPTYVPELQPLQMA